MLFSTQLADSCLTAKDRKTIFRRLRLLARTLRGASRHSAFIRQLWSAPEVVARISEIAGLALQPVFAYEQGHTNIVVSASLSKEKGSQPHSICFCCPQRPAAASQSCKLAQLCLWKLEPASKLLAVEYILFVQWPGKEPEVDGHWHRYEKTVCFSLRQG